MANLGYVLQNTGFHPNRVIH